ncbi:MAG: tetratricopeptide repeat protein [Sphingobium sp.]
MKGLGIVTGAPIWNNGGKSTLRALHTRHNPVHDILTIRGVKMGVIRLWAILLVSVASVGIAGAAQASTWYQARTRHFIVYSDGPQKQLTDFAEKLEKFDFLLRTMTGTPDADPGVPVVVYTLPSAQAVAAMAGRKNIAGYYEGARRFGYAVVGRERKDGRFDMGAEDILFHEYAHHFMLHYFPAAYPAWYVEGFAEFYSVIKFTPKQEIEFGNAPLYRAYSLITMQPMPLKQLFAGITEKTSAADMDRFYGTAWLLTHFFRYNPLRRAEFDKYLTDTVRGTAKEADSYFAGGLAGIDKELRAYLRNKIPATRLTPKEIPQVSVQLSPVEAGHAALMMQDIRGLHYGIEGMTEEQRKAFSADVRTIAARFPQSAYAQAFLAETERLVGAPDAALTAADKAIALDAQSSQAYATKADILLEKAYKSDDAATWKAALGAIVKANRANTEDAVPLAQFYRYYHMRGSKMPPIAYDGLYKALSLVPQYDEYRFMVAASLGNQKKYAEAARLLDPIAFSPHPTPGRESALKMRKELLDAEAKGGVEEIKVPDEPATTH